jgi:hypothetical protein
MITKIDLIALVVTGILLPILLYILYDRSEKRGDRKPPRPRRPRKIRDKLWFGKGCFADLLSIWLFSLLGLVVWGGIVCLVIFL